MASVAMVSPAADPEAELQRALVRLKDLHRPNPAFYWIDLTVSAGVGWGAFAGACVAAPWSWPMWLCAAVAVFALYRASVFIHELTHLRRGALPGFRPAWNLFVGYPLLLPSVLYEGVHMGHHRNSTYGTINDPEYIWVKGRPWTMIGFALAGLAEPVLLAVRFLVLGPVGLVCPPLQRRLETACSSFTINPAYRRTVGPRERRRLLSSQVGIILLWGSATALAYVGVLPLRTFAVWLGVYAAVCVINHLRTLVAHHYESDGRPLAREEQVRDSIDTPGGWWTELWAPLGLRYHALHHLAPSLPYHNMGRAYRRLTAELPPSSAYRASTTSGPWTSLEALRRAK